MRWSAFEERAIAPAHRDPLCEARFFRRARCRSAICTGLLWLPAACCNAEDLGLGRDAVQLRVAPRRFASPSKCELARSDSNEIAGRAPKLSHRAAQAHDMVRRHATRPRRRSAGASRRTVPRGAASRSCVRSSTARHPVWHRGVDRSLRYRDGSLS